MLPELEMGRGLGDGGAAPLRAAYLLWVLLVLLEVEDDDYAGAAKEILPSDQAPSSSYIVPNQGLGRSRALWVVNGPCPCPIPLLPGLQVGKHGVGRSRTAGEDQVANPYKV